MRFHALPQPRLLGAILLAGVSLSFLPTMNAGAKTEDGFTALFDGKSLDGWKASENVKSWRVEKGVIICKGPRSHLFFTADPKPFKNFHLKVDVLTKPKANSGIYFHTKFQETDWPKLGLEAQVNNSQSDKRKTGSLYAVMDVFDPPAKDDEWFTEEIIVKGRNVVIKVNGKDLVNYTEPADKKPAADFPRKLDEGTFALQAHDPDSEVHFKNIRVKRLPD
jgi:3-keto-disaccharide hydrolase